MRAQLSEPNTFYESHININFVCFVTKIVWAVMCSLVGWLVAFHLALWTVNERTVVIIHQTFRCMLPTDKRSTLGSREKQPA